MNTCQIPERILFTADDIPPGAVFRLKEGSPDFSGYVWFAPHALKESGVVFLQENKWKPGCLCSFWISWRILSERYEIRYPGEKGWHPCYNVPYLGVTYGPNDR